MSKKESKNLAKSVGKAIAKRRLACQLTQEYVAECLGIGVEAVSRIERGVSVPTVMRLAELATIFQCSIADLVTETSVRSTDQALYIQKMLSGLESQDRLVVMEVVETLVKRLKPDA